MVNGEEPQSRRRRIPAFQSAILIFGTALLAIGASVSGRAATITVAPLADGIGIGESVEVQVEISGLGHLEAPSVGVVDLDLSFDPAILSPTDGSLGDPVLGDQLDVLGLGSYAVATVGVGSINLLELSLDSVADLNSLQVGAFVIGTVIFEGLSAGTSPLSLSVHSIGDALGDPLSVDTSGSTVTVVPEPSTALLLACGLAGLAAAGGRRHLKN